MNEYDKTYCYVDSDVLRNKLDIHDADKLNEMERKITSVRLAELVKQPLPRIFGDEHLKRIHKHIFQDLYTWAGQFRTVDINKQMWFCLVPHMKGASQDIFNKLEKDHYLQGLDKTDFIGKLADYMADVNCLHPFREGNGRTQREFFRQLSEAAGYDLHIENWDNKQRIAADVRAVQGDTIRLKELIGIHIEPIVPHIKNLVKDAAQKAAFVNDNLQKNEQQVSQGKINL